MMAMGVAAAPLLLPMSRMAAVPKPALWAAAQAEHRRLQGAMVPVNIRPGVSAGPPQVGMTTTALSVGRAGGAA